MTADFRPSDPEKEQVVLELVDAQLEIKNFTEYSFNSSFLEPTVSWSFTVAAERLDDDLKAALVCGAKVRLSINGAAQATGYIDAIEVTASRDSGVEYRIEGQDTLGRTAASCCNMFQTFKTGMALADILVELFKPFGWSTADKFLVDNEANRAVQSLTQNRGQQLSRGGKKHPPKPLKSYVQHQVAPYAKEGVYEFASRLVNRAGLHIWCSADGDSLVVAKPDFDSAPLYTLRRNYDGTTNVLEGTVRYSAGDQPTAIFIDGFTNGGEYGRGRAQAFAYNPAVVVKSGGGPITDLKALHPNAREVVLPVQQNNVVYEVPFESIQYLTDNECQTQEQLENSMKRHMALLQRHSLTVSYLVEGHGQSSADGFAAWTVDTTVNVEDEIAGLSETLYVLSRTFHKSRSGGTTTRLELIRLHSLAF